MGLYLWCLTAGYYFAPKQTFWSKEVALCCVITASAFIAIPFSFFFEARNPAATGLLAMLTLLLMPLLFIRNVERIFYALIPGWFLQASVMAWQWFVEGVYRAGGIAENENAGSAFLLLGALFLIQDKRLKWLSVPLLVAIPFSGSRWVLVVGCMIFGLIFLSKHVRWRWIAVGIAISTMVLVAAQHDRLAIAYRLHSSVHQDVTHRANARDAEFSFWKIWIPRGFHDTNLHSLPIRMADETGLLSALAWIGVGAICLWRKPRMTWQWWGLAAVCLLSVMYYFIWIGPLGALWWLYVAELRGTGVPEAKERPLESNRRG